MRRMGVAFLFPSFFILFGCSSDPSRPTPVARQPAPQKPYVTPVEFTLTPIAERGPQGEIYISGTTNFPDGMKMRVVLGPKKAQQNAFVRAGNFRSGPLYEGVPVPIAGSQRLEITAYFNGAWQNNTVLAALGDGGENLHGKLFKNTHPDVIDSDKILYARFTVVLLPIARETWLDFARDSGYLSTKKHKELLAQYEEIGKMLHAMIDHPDRFAPLSIP